MLTLRRWEVEDINLYFLVIKYSLYSIKRFRRQLRKEEEVLTVSEVRVLGTATNNSSSSAVLLLGREHFAKEQKFIVFTSSICRSHGAGRGVGGVSTGKTVLKDFSSSLESFQMHSLLSFPCLMYC